MAPMGCSKPQEVTTKQRKSETPALMKGGKGKDQTKVDGVEESKTAPKDADKSMRVDLQEKKYVFDSSDEEYSPGEKAERQFKKRQDALRIAKSVSFDNVSQLDKTAYFKNQVGDDER